MRGERRWLLVGGTALLVAALASVVFVASRGGPTGRTEAPVAVVLVPGAGGSELVSVDLDNGRVIRRTRLRSLVTDIAADPARQLVVGAQTGGIGGEADDALSITDPRSGVVRYVKLPRRDPSQVELVSGKAMVLHAVLEVQGFVVSGVEVGSGVAEVAGHVPEGTGLWAEAAGSLWTSVPAHGGGSVALVRIDPATLATSPGPTCGFSPFEVIGVGDRVLAMGSAGTAGVGGARVALLEAKTGSVVASASVGGLPHGAWLAAQVGREVVLGDWNGDEPETGTLQVLDAATLAPLRTIHTGGTPCAIAGCGDRLLVVDRVAGTLAKLDPLTGRTDWRADLGVRDLVSSEVVAFPGVAVTRSALSWDGGTRIAAR